MVLVEFKIFLLFAMGYTIQVIAHLFLERKKKVNYQTYLQSHTWRKKRLERLAIDKWKCQSCKTDLKKTTPHIHHKTYKRLGREKMKDLVSLCQSCHIDIHRNK